MNGAGGMVTAQRDLEDLYAEHYDVLLRHASRRLGSASEAEDFVHDSFVRAAEKVNLSTLENPRAYLMRVVDNAIFNAYRKSSRLVLQGESRDLPDPDFDVAKEHELEEARHLVAASLKTLAPRHRRVLSMFAGGIPLADIAAAEGSTRHKISCIITRAKDNLGKELIRRGFVPGVVPTTSLTRVRGAFFDLRTRMGGFFERLDKDAVAQALLAATIAAAGTGGVGATDQAEAAPPLAPITSTLPLDPTLLPANLESATSVLSSTTNELSKKVGFAKKAIGRGERADYPDDEEGPLPEPPIVPDPNEVVDEVVNIAASVPGDVVEVAKLVCTGLTGSCEVQSP